VHVSEENVSNIEWLLPFSRCISHQLTNRSLLTFRIEVVSARGTVSRKICKDAYQTGLVATAMKNLVAHAVVCKRNLGSTTDWSSVELLSLVKSISVDVPFTYRLVCSRNRFVVTVPLPCSDINECAATFTGRRCSPQATCNNSLGSYSCRCNDGFSGDGFTCSGKIFVDFRLDETRNSRLTAV
jgi:hypothetical protein